MVQITLARVYDRPGPEAGFRVLVDRVWPRGVARRRALGRVAQGAGPFYGPAAVVRPRPRPGRTLPGAVFSGAGRRRPSPRGPGRTAGAAGPARRAGPAVCGQGCGVQQCRGPAALSAGTRRRPGCRPRRGLALKSRSAEFFCAKGVAPGKRERAAFFRAFPDRGCPACAQKIKEVAEVGRFAAPFRNKNNSSNLFHGGATWRHFWYCRRRASAIWFRAGGCCAGLQAQARLAVDAGLAPLARLLYPLCPGLGNWPARAATGAAWRAQSRSFGPVAAAGLCGGLQLQLFRVDGGALSGFRAGAGTRLPAHAGRPAAFALGRPGFRAERPAGKPSTWWTSGAISARSRPCPQPSIPGPCRGAAASG